MEINLRLIQVLYSLIVKAAKLGITLKSGLFFYLIKQIYKIFIDYALF
jgi:hypothetical protein